MDKSMTAKRHYIPHGIDQQGRLPQAERPELPEDLNCAAGIVTWVLVALVLWALVAAVIVAVVW